MRAAVVVLAALAAGVLGYGWWRTETHATFSMTLFGKRDAHPLPAGPERAGRF